MPHLVYRRRYWRVAGDEFSLPAFCTIVGRIFWTILVCIIFAFSIENLQQCEGGWIYIFYLTASIAIFVASIFCDSMLMVISLRGSIAETEQRKGLAFYLNGKLMLGFFQFLCAVFGVISLSVESEIPCNSHFEGSELNRAFVAVVTISQIVDFSSMLCCCYLFMANKIDEENDQPQDKDWALNTWEARCRTITRSIQICSCNLFGGNNITEGFDEVAKVLTDFFHHDGFLDVVPSDVVAGIVLVRMEQRHHRRLRRLDTLARSADFPNVSGGDKSAELLESGSARSAATHSIRSDGGVANVSSAAGGAGALKLRRSGAGNGSRTDCTASATGLGLGPETMVVKGSVLNLIPQEQQLDLDVQTLDEIARYAVYSTAMYSHIIAIYLRPCSGLCRLCARGSCGPTTAPHSRCAQRYCCCCSAIPGSCFRPKPSLQLQQLPAKSGAWRLATVEGDNYCGMNHTGVSEVLTDNLADKMKNTELVHASFKNDPLHKVYAVFVDHAQEKVVIGIRGTLSLEDCITDVICDPVELSSVGAQYGFEGSGRYAHAGMLKAALHIRAELETNDTLNRVFGSGPPTSTMQTPLNEKSGNCANYKLIITGHSLGAGSSIILGLLLRRSYPTLHVYAYGTPGSVLDKQLCREVSSFVTSVVMGNDLVCRLSLKALHQLREDVLDAISRAKVNKMLIMQAIFKEFSPDDFMHPKGQEPDSAFKRGIKEFKSKVFTSSSSDVELSIPGRIIHFTKSKIDRSCCRNRVEYSMVEAHLEDFCEIVMSTTMGADHLPDSYLAQTQDALKRKLRTMTV